jgi:hypothetical protein
MDVYDSKSEKRKIMHVKGVVKKAGGADSLTMLTMSYFRSVHIWWWSREEEKRRPYRCGRKIESGGKGGGGGEGEGEGTIPEVAENFHPVREYGKVGYQNISLRG